MARRDTPRVGEHSGPPARARSGQLRARVAVTEGRTSGRNTDGHCGSWRSCEWEENAPLFHQLLTRLGCGFIGTCSRRAPFFDRRRPIVCLVALHSPRSRACISSVTCSAIRARSAGLVMPRNRHDIAPPCARLHFAWDSRSGSARGLSAARLVAWSASRLRPQRPSSASMGRWHRKQGAPGLVCAISARRAAWCRGPDRALLCGLRGTVASLGRGAAPPGFWLPGRGHVPGTLGRPSGAPGRAEPREVGVSVRRAARALVRGRLARALPDRPVMPAALADPLAAVGAPGAEGYADDGDAAALRAALDGSGGAGERGAGHQNRTVRPRSAWPELMAQPPQRCSAGASWPMRVVQVPPHPHEWGRPHPQHRAAGSGSTS